MTASSTDPSAQRAARLLAVGFEGTVLSTELMALLDRGVSGVILFSRNIESPAQVARLICDIKNYASQAVYVAVDQEGGAVARLRTGFTRFPNMRAIGTIGASDIAWQVGKILGRELRAVGIDVNFAPVLDVDTNPQNPVIGDRAFSSDAAEVARLGVALGQGIESEGVASCGKHFPGHGDTDQDSHLMLPVLRHDLARLNEVELVPFRAWAEAKLASIMTAHVVFEAVDPVYPATMSKRVMTDILRKQLGYDGLVISDDLEMKAVFDHYGASEAAVLGLDAGVDHFLVCRSAQVAHLVIDALAEAVANGRVKVARLLEAVARVEAFLARFAHVAAPFDEQALASAEAVELLLKIDQMLGQPALEQSCDPTERHN